MHLLCNRRKERKMSRRENGGYYVPVGGGPQKNAVERFIDKYRLPALKEMLISAAIAFGVCIAIALILVITGLRFVSVTADNDTYYRYFGWIYKGAPVLGSLHGSDGTNASIYGGKVVYSDGSTYWGELKDFAKNGKGTVKYKDGSAFDGEFKNDLPHGKGTFVRSDGSGYSGDYIKGLYEGNGTLRLADGTVYSGGFYEGEFEGQGTLTYYNGDSFTGKFKNGMRFNGVYRWADGSSIEGSFTNNAPTATEKLIYTDVSGDTYKAYYIDGELTGRSAYERPPEDKAAG